MPCGNAQRDKYAHLDITTGDKITPKEIEYQFKLLLEDRSISALAYNLETIMAEKLETVISRGDRIPDQLGAIASGKTSYVY